MYVRLAPISIVYSKQGLYKLNFVTVVVIVESPGLPCFNRGMRKLQIVVIIYASIAMQIAWCMPTCPLKLEIR